MRASVIIPVFNDAERLRLCLDALTEQTQAQGDFEAVVVDNGSESPPRELIQSYPFASFAEEAAPGSYAARNRALEIARGEVLVFTDADCIPQPDWLARGIERLQAEGGHAFISGSIEVFAADPDAATAMELIDLAFGFQHAKHDYAVTANLFALRRHFSAVGPFNDKLMSGGDVEWSGRAKDVGLRLVHAPDVVVRHPARRSLREGVTKRRRVMGGRVASRGQRKPARSRWRLLLPDLGSLSAGRQRLKTLGYGRLDRVRMAIVFTYLHYIGLIEAARNLLGKAAERR